MYGLQDRSLKFLKSYVNSRFQNTVVDGHKSTSARLECGTAQGSILGPLFFTLYVNDIFAYVSQINSLTMYADDTLLIEQGDTTESSNIACQNRFKEVETWCNLNKLCINVDKTKSMVIQSRNIDPNYRPLIVVAGKRLQNVSKYEYLGVIMDDKLNMSNHIEHITKKVQSKLCILRKLRKHITEDVALKIFKGLILCHFDYGDFLVDSGSKGNIEKLGRLYTRSVRCVEYRSNVRNRLKIDDLYVKYKLETLENRRKKNLLKIMYKESKVDGNIDMYRPQQVLGSTKNVKLKHKFTRLTKIQRSPYYRGLELWDKIPLDIQTSTTSIEFKNAIRGYVL